VRGEDRFVEELRALLPPSTRVRIGPGDDAAVLSSAPADLVLTTDLLVEGVDFLPDENPETIGRRALAINLSDMAAMGGRPEFFLLSVAFPAERGREFPLAVARGALARALPYGIDLVGGDLSDARQIVVSVLLGGRIDRAPVTRSGAKAGDLLFLSGWPGRAAAGLRLARRRAVGGKVVNLDPEQEKELITAYRDPEPRVELGLWLGREGIAHAAIDVSDGLGLDASRLARSSGVRVVLDRARIPVSSSIAAVAADLREDPFDWILSGGDDYELLFAVAPENVSRIEEHGAEQKVPLTRIGAVEKGSGAVLRGADGDTDISNFGHDHLDSRLGQEGPAVP